MPLVTERFASVAAGEATADPQLVAVGATVPCGGFATEVWKVRDPSSAQALPTHHADLDLSLVQPASMLWREVKGEAVPQRFPALRTKPAREGLEAVSIQVVHDGVNRLGPWVG